MRRSIKEMDKRLDEREQEIERLNNIIKTKDEGIKAFTEDLCEESTKVEKLEKLNKKLWEENTRLSNGRELDQNAIDTLRDRIDKAIEYIEEKYDYILGDDTFLDHDERIDRKQINHIIEILKGSDKE